MADERFVVTEQMTTGYLEPFTAATVGLALDSNIPTNLMPGANYVIVGGELVEEYSAGRFDVEDLQPDGFSLIFTGVVPPVRLNSTKS